MFKTYTRGNNLTEYPQEEPLLSGTLLKMTRSTENAVQSAINNPKSIASWRNNFGGHDNRLSRLRYTLEKFTILEFSQRSGGLS